MPDRPYCLQCLSHGCEHITGITPDRTPPIPAERARAEAAEHDRDTYRQDAMDWRARAEKAEAVVARLRNPPEAMLEACDREWSAKIKAWDAIREGPLGVIRYILRAAADWTPPPKKPTPTTIAEKAAKLRRLCEWGDGDDGLIHKDHIIDLLDAIEEKGPDPAPQHGPYRGVG